MKKTLLRIASVLPLLAMGLAAQAQAVNLLGGRFVVNAPAPLGGQKTEFEVANDGSGDANQWGRAIDSVWLNVPLAKAFAGTDSLGCGSITTDVSAKFALIRRGECSFTEKAAGAQAAGAMGVLIANHTAGAGVAGMAFTEGFGSINIPVMMITKELGDSLYAALNMGVPVSISLSRWGFGVPNDLTLVPESIALFHALGIPYKQLAAGNGNPEAYNVYTSAIVANTGSDDQTNIKLVQKVNFTPVGGSTTQIAADSVTISGTFQTSDSIDFYSKTSGAMQIHVDAPGKLDFHVTATSDQTDDYPADNSGSYHVMATDDMYSKGTVDPVTMKPRVYGSVKYAGSTPMVWGPLYYVATGGDTMKYIQFAVNDNNSEPHSLVGTNFVTARLYRWSDANNDGVVTIGELTQKGAGIYSFTEADSNYSILKLQMVDLDGESPIMLESDSWYYVAVEMPNELYMGYDIVNYYSRLASTNNNADYTSPTMEFWSGQYSSNTLEGADVNDSLFMIPFRSGYTANNYDLDSIAFSSGARVPVVTMHVGPGLSVQNTVRNFKEVSLFPNPVQNELNVSVSLNQNAKQFHYILTDVVGRTLQTGNLYNVQDTKFTLNTTFLATGTYYLIMNDGQQTFSRKFVKDGK